MLIVSNGHGEDALGVLFAEALQRVWPGIEVAAFPVVGMGDSYRRAGIAVVGVQREMPSGGFMRQEIRPLVADLRAGLLELTRRQIRSLRELGGSYTWAVAMGDVYPLWLCARHVRRPFVFFPTAKSDYIRPHNRLEVAWMRRWPAAVFPRDLRTAEGLGRQGIRTFYVGNLMMDALRPSGRTLPGSGPLVALLPGSRQEAYENARLLLAAVEALPAAYRYALALASQLESGALAGYVRTAGWAWQEVASGEGEPGLVGVLRKAQWTVGVYRGRFADILHEADAVLGMAGTANEQAAGLGKPVITCPGKGPQFTPRFVAAQSRLLGAALLVTEPDPQALAAGVRKVLADPELYRRMAEEGRRRMGEPGAAERAARVCLELAELRQGAAHGG